MLAIARQNGSTFGGLQGPGMDDPSTGGDPVDALVQKILQEIQMLLWLQQMLAQLLQQQGGGGDGGSPAVGGPSAAAPAGMAPAMGAAPGGSPAAAAPAPVAAASAGAPAAPAGQAAPAQAAAPVDTSGSGGDMTPQQVASAYKDQIAAASNATGVPPGILAGQIWQESKGKAGTPGGGLMQLGDNEFRKYGGGDISNAGDNIKAGANYMKDLMTQFGGNVGAALRAYNSGPNGVDLGNLDSTPAGTGDPSYVQKVMQAAQASGLSTTTAG